MSGLREIWMTKLLDTLIRGQSSGLSLFSSELPSPPWQRQPLSDSSFPINRLNEFWGKTFFLRSGMGAESNNFHPFTRARANMQGVGGGQHPLTERNPEVTSFSSVELLHLFGATSLTEWSRAELSCNGSLGELQDCYMPTGKPPHIEQSYSSAWLLTARISFPSNLQEQPGS